MEALIALLVVPIILLNFLGGIVSGIWLIIIGDWGTFLSGLAYMLFGAFGLSILMFPGLALALPVVKLLESGREKMALLVGLPSLLWTYGLLTISCVWVFSWVMASAENATVPYLLWSYAVATAPWTYMAQKDAQAGNDSAAHTAFFAQLGMISLFVAYLTDPSDLSIGRLVWWFAPLMVAALLFSLVMAWAETRARRARAFDGYS